MQNYLSLWFLCGHFMVTFFLNGVEVPAQTDTRQSRLPPPLSHPLSHPHIDLTCSAATLAPTCVPATARRRQGCDAINFSTLTSRCPRPSPPKREQPENVHLERPLRLIRRPRPVMSDFLASFGLGAQAASTSNNLPCDSVDDLDLHLRRVLNEKATPFRAEHVSITMELRATVRFSLSLPERENGDIDGLNSVDPLLGRTPVSEEQPSRHVSRNVGANEALMNQPQSDPVLQTSIAKHIIAILGVIDGSDWTVREVTREAQGWTFTYLCRNSFQVWSRQHAKSSSKSIVGEYSQREPDPGLHGRSTLDLLNTHSHRV